MACKFGNLNYTSNKEFTKTFIKECTETLLNSHLLLISKHKTNFASNKTLFYSLKFVNAVLLNEHAVCFLEPNL